MVKKRIAKYLKDIVPDSHSPGRLFKWVNNLGVLQSEAEIVIVQGSSSRVEHAAYCSHVLLISKRRNENATASETCGP